jgi:hypothetical protein
MLAMLGQLTRAGVDELSDAAGESLGWDGARKQAEVARTLEIMATCHGLVLSEVEGVRR